MACLDNHPGSDPQLALPLVASILAITLVATTGGLRTAGLLPVLPPLCLLAALGVTSLRRGAANAFDWFGMMTFSLLAGLIWLGWAAMVFGVPPQIAKNLARLEPGFVARFSALALAVSLGLTFAWLWVIFASPRSPQGGTTHWAAGITLCWGLLMALWLPLIDYDRTYRPVALALKKALPEQPHPDQPSMRIYCFYYRIL